MTSLTAPRCAGVKPTRKLWWDEEEDDSRSMRWYAWLSTAKDHAKQLWLSKPVCSMYASPKVPTSAGVAQIGRGFANNSARLCLFWAN